jgi:hypothetical protein
MKNCKKFIDGEFIDIYGAELRGECENGKELYRIYTG